MFILLVMLTGRSLLLLLHPSSARPACCHQGQVLQVKQSGGGWRRRWNFPQRSNFSNEIQIRTRSLPSPPAKRTQVQCFPVSNASLSRYRSKSSFLSCPSYSSPSRCLCLGPGARQRARGRLEGASCTCLNHQITDGNTTTRLVCCSQQNNEGKVILIQ